MQSKICVKVSPELKSEYRRAVQLLGRNQTEPLYRAVLRTIRLAREQYPKFDAISAVEEDILDAIAAGCHEVEQISEYVRLTEANTSAALKALAKRKLIDTRVKGLAVPRNNAGKRVELFFLPE